MAPPNMQARQEFEKLLAARYPGLVEAVRTIVERSERAFTKRRRGGGSSYLWEHTAAVVSLAYKLATAEKADVEASVLAALFHDTGKFAGGAYHDDEEPEEKAAAAVAKRVMDEFRVAPMTRRRVLQALAALYSSRARRDKRAAVVHDADFLAKAGTLGVAEFFIKSTLRGRTLLDAVRNSLSKELTYAATLPANMRTKAGRRQAARKAGITQSFFRDLLRELRESQGLDLRVVRTAVPLPGRRPLDVRLVMGRTCDACGASPSRPSFAIEHGVKCEMLEARVRCAHCRSEFRVSFCVPEMGRSLRGRAHK